MVDHTISNTVQVDPDVAQTRLTAYVNEGRARSAQIVQNLMDEAARRRDVVVSRNVMTFAVAPKSITLQVANPQLPDPLGFTEWSAAQALETLHIPQKFIEGLQGDGPTGTAIATRTMNDLRYRIGGEEETNGRSRRLLRVVDNTVKGWLSPTYGLIDQANLLTGFTKALAHVKDQNVYLTGGEITDRRYFVSAMKAQIFQPWPGEFIVIGGDLQSSDYGFGAVDFVQKVIRLICRNGLIGVSFFRRIHHGSSLGDADEAVFEISDRTRRLAAATSISRLTDGVRTAFSDFAITSVLNKYQEARVKEINPEAAAKRLREKSVIGKDDVEKIPALLQQDVEFLPDTPNKNSALRLSQLLAYMSNGEPNGEKKIALMEEAGKLVIA